MDREPVSIARRKLIIIASVQRGELEHAQKQLVDVEFAVNLGIYFGMNENDSIHSMTPSYESL